MNQAEKERYLREYEVLKKKGKPFFPYAVAKDSAMMFVVFCVIALLAIVLGAEQGPKVDPTTTTYTPRPSSPPPPGRRRRPASGPAPGASAHRQPVRRR